MVVLTIKYYGNDGIHHRKTFEVDVSLRFQQREIVKDNGDILNNWKIYSRGKIMYDSEDLFYLPGIKGSGHDEEKDVVYERYLDCLVQEIPKIEREILSVYFNFLYKHSEYVIITLDIHMQADEEGHEYPMISIGKEVIGSYSVT